MNVSLPRPRRPHQCFPRTRRWPPIRSPQPSSPVVNSPMRTTTGATAGSCAVMLEPPNWPPSSRSLTAWPRSGLSPGRRWCRRHAMYSSDAWHSGCRPRQLTRSTPLVPSASRSLTIPKRSMNLPRSRHPAWSPCPSPRGRSRRTRGSRRSHRDSTADEGRRTHPSATASPPIRPIYLEAPIAFSESTTSPQRRVSPWALRYQSNCQACE